MRVLILLFIFLIGLSSCYKPEECPRYFQLYADLSPIQETYKLGDTITVTSIFSKHLKGYNYKDEYLGTYDMEGIKWKPQSTFQRVDTIGYGGTSDVINNIEFMPNPKYQYSIFQGSRGISIIDGEYTYKNDSFYLQYQFVLKKTGDFLLTHSSQLGVEYNEQEFDGRCRKHGGFEAWVKMNGGENNNVQLLKESPDEHWNTYFYDRLERKFYKRGGYCFRVIE